jgi:hypothetical protein
MKTRWSIASVAFALAATTSCGSRATPEEARALGHGAADDESALAGCIDRCLEDRTGKFTTDCRANAVDLAGFHVCK